MDGSTNEQTLCHHCSCVIENDPVWIENNPYCEDCTFECEHCHEIGQIDNQHIIGRDNGTQVCQRCFDNEAQLCSICDNWELTDNLADVDGCLVCPTCVEESVSCCELCEEDHLDENMVNTWDGRQLCEQCAREEGYTETCVVCDYLAKQQDIEEMPKNFNEALKNLVKLADLNAEFTQPTKMAKVCKACQKNALSIKVAAGTSTRSFLEIVFPKIAPWQINLRHLPDDAKVAIISDARYGRVPIIRNNGTTMWTEKILAHVTFQVLTNEVYDKAAELNNILVPTTIITKEQLVDKLVMALNDQNIHALKLPGAQIIHQAEYSWRKNFPDEEIPTTMTMEIEMLPFHQLAAAIGDETLDNRCLDWRQKLRNLEQKISQYNEQISLRQLNGNNNNTEGDGMRCTLCNSLIDENNKIANETGICMRCIYGEMCPECKKKGYPVCPDCLINYGKQKNKLETKLFQLSNNNMVRRYHDSTDNFIKSTKLRMPDEKPYLYYGIELEMCIPFDRSTSNFAKEMLEAGKGLFVAESDSSLDNGVEFISRPLSYKRWKSPEVQQILNDMKKVAEKFRYDQMCQDSAGMHVHLSKLFFQKNTTKTTNEQIDDLNWIIQNYEKELRPITGREPGDYNRSMFSNIERDLKAFIESRNLKQATITTKIDKTRIPMDHHSMISMSNSGETVEVRAFKGTCDPLTIMARIELCRNLAHFARKYDIENMTLDKAFNCKQSPFLEQYIKDNKIEVDSKKKLKSSQNVKIEVKSR